MSNETKPVKFPEPITATPYGSSATLTFVDTAELYAWAVGQLKDWAALDSESITKKGGITDVANGMFSAFRNLAAITQDLESRAASNGVWISGDPFFTTALGRIRTEFSRIEAGETFCTDTAGAARALSLLPNNPFAAAVCIYVYTPSKRNQFKLVNNSTSLLADVLQGIIESTDANPMSATLETSTRAFEDLRNRSEHELRGMQNQRATEADKLTEFWAARADSVTSRDKQWDDELVSIREQWEKLKKTYDTDLALRAPTTYWSEKQERHRRFSIAYAIVFVVIVAVGLFAFLVYGLPVLSRASEEAARNGAYIPRLVEIAIPAFLGIWVLRIVGRMLSTHLQFMEDAGERATMVKTFLALMNDEQQGRALVRDEDRILILSALFRHSSATGADDAPPVSWFDLLMTRLKPDK